VKSTLAAALIAATAVLGALATVGASGEAKTERPYSDNSIVSPESPAGSTGHGPL
jgi:hypothetical protein